MKLLLFVALMPTFLLAQSNIFVSDNNLSVMRPTPDGGYVGGDAEDNLVKLNSDFEFVWAVGSFSGVLTDMVVDAASSTITAVYILDDQCHITQLDN